MSAARPPEGAHTAAKGEGIPSIAARPPEGAPVRRGGCARAVRPVLALAGVALAGIGCPSAAADETARFAQGKALFAQGSVPACALCHTLRDAGAEGAVGPSLDEIKPDARRVAKALRNGLGQMPSYDGRLTDEQIAALALYVSKVSGAAQ